MLLQLLFNMVYSFVEAYAPNLKLTYCEVAKIIELTFLVSQHVYILTVTRDVVTIIIC
jgi:hypothetical protein